MKKLIFTAFAVAGSKVKSVNTHNKNPLKTYYENICVSLFSTKCHNPNVDVALITNQDPPEEIKSFLSKQNIMIISKDFVSFNFGENIKWAGAYYKLCALSYVVKELDYDYFALIDCDTYIQDSFDNIWKECEDYLLLYDINHGYQVHDYLLFLNDVKKYYREEKNITHYGGEFVAGSKQRLNFLVNKMTSIYKEMISDNITFGCGDEGIISIAAASNKEIIKNAAPYIYRFWTGTFRLVSSCYCVNKVTILHLPDEKDGGLHKLYKLIKQKRKIKDKDVYRICHIKKPSLKTSIKIFAKEHFFRR